MIELTINKTNPNIFSQKLNFLRGASDRYSVFSLCPQNKSQFRATQRRLRLETGGTNKFKDFPNELIEALVKYGNNQDGIPALHYAIKCRDEKAVSLLLRHGADPNAKSRDPDIQIEFQHDPLPITALDFAAAFANPRIIEILVKSGAEVNPSSMKVDCGPRFMASPLQFAILHNQIGNIKCLIDQGAEKFHSKIYPFFGLSPLQLAASLGNADALKILVTSSKEANYLPDFMDNMVFPDTPLALAIRSGNVEAIEFLLQTGALPNLGKPQQVQIGWGNPPQYETIPNVSYILCCYQAPDEKLPQILSLLLDYGMNVNMRDNNNNTLLINLINRYERCESKDLKFKMYSCINSLLTKGARVKEKGWNGLTAFDYAKSAEIKGLLLVYS